MISPLNHATTSVYYGSGDSQAGLLASTTDPLGHTVSYQYDAVGRRTAQVDQMGNAPSANAADHTTHYEYDRHGNRTRMTDGTGTTRYRYDERDQLLEQEAPGPSLTKYRYDAAGQRTRLIYPNGQAVSYRFDAAGRLDRLTDWATRQTSRRRRSPRSPPTARGGPRCRSAVIVGFRRGRVWRR